MPTMWPTCTSRRTTPIRTTPRSAPTAPGEGYTLKHEQSLPEGTGDVTVMNPRDGHTITVASGNPPAMALLISRPCHRSEERLRAPSSTPIA
jgi:hypothetical protein